MYPCKAEYHVTSISLESLNSSLPPPPVAMYVTSRSSETEEHMYLYVTISNTNKQTAYIFQHQSPAANVEQIKYQIHKHPKAQSPFPKFDVWL